MGPGLRPDLVAESTGLMTAPHHVATRATQAVILMLIVVGAATPELGEVLILVVVVGVKGQQSFELC
jgi:hypothetical protein